MTTATKTRKTAARRSSRSAGDFAAAPFDAVAVTDDDCAGQLQACRIRICQLDTDGSPLAGADSSVVSDDLVKLTITPNYKAATEISESNACDEVKVNYLGPPSKVRDDIDIDFVTPNPFLHAVLLSQGELLSLSGGGYGFAAPPIGPIESNGVSIEVWTKRIIDGVLSVVHPYAHWALPKVLNIQQGARELSNTAQHTLLTAQAYESDLWFDGPGDDFDATSDRTWQWIPADTLPDVTCGFVTVAGS